MIKEYRFAGYEKRISVNLKYVTSAEDTGGGVTMIAAAAFFRPIDIDISYDDFMVDWLSVA